MKKEAVKKTVTTKKLAAQIPVFTANGEKGTDIAVPTGLAEAKLNKSLLTQAVRVTRINKRQGTVGTKTRSHVIGSTRKIYRQKGTGRARHGSLKAPIFVGGGVAFGPHPRDFSAKLTKKMRAQALQHAIMSKMQTQKLMLVSGLSDLTGKTKQMHALLEKLKLNNKSLLFIFDPTQKTAQRATRNIDRVVVRSVGSFGIDDIVTHEYLVVAQEAWETYIGGVKG